MDWHFKHWFLMWSLILSAAILTIIIVPSWMYLFQEKAGYSTKTLNGISCIVTHENQDVFCPIVSIRER